MVFNFLTEQTRLYLKTIIIRFMCKIPYIEKNAPRAAPNAPYQNRTGVIRSL